MTTRAKCIDCGAISTVPQFERDGCWHCTQLAEQEQLEEAFASFMLLDETDRWRKIWEMARGNK